MQENLDFFSSHFFRQWQKKGFSNFSCRFLNPNYFFQFVLVQCIRSRKPPGTSQKTILFQKLFWPFIVWINCSSDLIFLNHKNNLFAITITIFLNIRSEQFWKQNTIVAFLCSINIACLVEKASKQGLTTSATILTLAFFGVEKKVV